jgi:predicted ATP-dependent Lon-type protease
MTIGGSVDVLENLAGLLQVCLDAIYKLMALI